jgi:hypothetical protein
MKNVLYIIVFVLILILFWFFFRSPRVDTNPFNISKEFLAPGDSVFLVFLNPNEFGVNSLLSDSDTSSLDNKTFTNLIDESKKKIRDFAKSKKIDRVKEEDIFVGALPGFKVTHLTKEEIENLMRNSGIFSKDKVKAIQVEFSIQNIRARMQSTEVFPQNIRARMQEWNYNLEKRTSNGIMVVGGPVDGSAKTTKVWVLDTGIDGTHPDLQTSLQGISEHKSFVEGQMPLEDPLGHGTFCAGLIGASTKVWNEDSTSFNGVSSGAKIVSVKVLGNDGSGNFSDVWAGLNYAVVNSGIGDIISMSLGGDWADACKELTIEFDKALNKVLRKKKVYLVMSAGNKGAIKPDGTDPSAESSTINCPGCMNGSNLITVGSISGDYVNQNVHFSEFSYFGSPAIDYVTPGETIFSTYTNGGYTWLSGTSASAAIMSGIMHASDGNPKKLLDVTRMPENKKYTVPKIK